MYFRKTLYCFILFLLSLFAEKSFAQNKNNNDIEPIDSVIYAYYLKCLEYKTDTIVLSMSDTLFQMAGKDNDERMQAVALCTQLDYYYYSNHPQKRDSVVAWVNRVKSFAKKTDQPKYYYFAWGSRLIYYYIHSGNYHLALVEAEKMLKEAEAENNLEGIMTCYNSMSAIYSKKGLKKQALENIRKEIDLFEKHELKRYNIAIQYLETANILIDSDRLDSVPYFLNKAKENVKMEWHEVLYNSSSTSYYLAIKNYREAEKYLNYTRELFKTHKALNPHLQSLYLLEVNYYRHIQDYTNSLKSLELWKYEMDLRKENSATSEYIKAKANIYWLSNRKADAAQMYRKYIELQDIEKEKAEQITTAEFATLLDLQQVNAEKQELENLSRKRTLQNIRIITMLLSLLLAVVIFFLYRQRKINRQLKRSKEELDHKNLTLLNAKDELNRAKETAERNSLMKTVFIQNMSHEIRTPLNSIVGFSAVLSSLFGNENEDVKQYATLIDNNSQILLKLIDDILTIAYLDDPLVKTVLGPTDINLCCERSLQPLREQVAPHVKLEFTPAYNELIVKSNAGNIIMVLSHLLNNSIKFTEKGSIVLTYNYVEKQEELTLTVTDTGKGIPPDKQEIVFERFVKLDEFTQGTGLGLSICRIVAKRLGGDIIIDKEYTPGTRIHFTIPAHLISERGQEE